MQNLLHLKTDFKSVLCFTKNGESTIQKKLLKGQVGIDL